MASKRRKKRAATPVKNVGEHLASGSASRKKADNRKKAVGKRRATKKPVPLLIEDSAVSTPAPSSGFPIVGIGASAGGLEALEEFFERMPADPGMAFVVVTHQPPR